MAGNPNTQGTESDGEDKKPDVPWAELGDTGRVKAMAVFLNEVFTKQVLDTMNALDERPLIEREVERAGFKPEEKPKIIHAILDFFLHLRGLQHARIPVVFENTDSKGVPEPEPPIIHPMAKVLIYRAEDVIKWMVAKGLELQSYNDEDSAREFFSNLKGQFYEHFFGRRQLEVEKDILEWDVHRAFDMAITIMASKKMPAVMYF